MHFSSGISRRHIPGLVKPLITQFFMPLWPVHTALFTVSTFITCVHSARCTFSHQSCRDHIVFGRFSLAFLPHFTIKFLCAFCFMWRSQLILTFSATSIAISSVLFLSSDTIFPASQSANTRYHRPCYFPMAENFVKFIIYFSISWQPIPVFNNRLWLKYTNNSISETPKTITFYLILF